MKIMKFFKIKMVISERPEMTKNDQKK